MQKIIDNGIMSYETTEDVDDGSYYYKNQLLLKYDNGVPYETFWSRIGFDMSNLPETAAVERAYLTLTAKPGSAGYFLVGNRVYSLFGGKAKIDVTSVLLKETNNFIDIKPVTYAHTPATEIEFYTDGDNVKPVLEFLYANEAAVSPAAKEIALNDRMSVYVDLVGGKANFKIAEFTANDTSAGVCINQYYGNGGNTSEEYGGWPVNLCERIYNAHLSDPAGYEIVDAAGNGDYLRKKFYYTSSDSVVYLDDAQIGEVTYNSLKEPVYNGNVLTVEYCTSGGYKYYSEAPSKLNGISAYKQMSESDDNKVKPVHFLSDGSTTKCYNRYGFLVLVANAYGICYKLSYNAASEITAVTQYSNDGENEEITFDYDDGKITQICAPTHYAMYTYDDSGRLRDVFIVGDMMRLTYSGDMLTGVKTDSGYESLINYDGDGRLGSVAIYSTLTAIPDGQTAEEPALLSAITVTYSDNTTKLTDENGNAEYYVFDSDGRLAAYYAETNGKVSAAQKYTYVGNGKQTVQSAKKSTLYKKPYSQYVFKAGESVVTEYDVADRALIVSRVGVQVSDDVTMDIVTKYAYNASGLCMHEWIYKIYNTSTSSPQSTYQYEYTYNSEGLLVRKKGYTTDNDVHLPVMVEDYGYTASGQLRKVKRYKYIDPSAGNPELYDCCEYDGYGRVTMRTNELVGDKIYYSYAPGTSRLKYVTMPEISAGTPKYQYTYDSSNRLKQFKNDSFLAFANQITYNSGKTAEFECGNESISYTYDNKRRLSGIKVNGADYVTFTYGEGTLNDKPTEEVTGTNANGDVYKLVQAKDGSFAQSYFNGQLQCEQEYNADGSLKKEKDGITGRTITYAYDAAGHIKNYTSERLSSVKYSASYEYNAIGGVKKITCNDGDGTYENSGTAYSELADGERVSCTTFSVAKDWFGRLTSKTIYEGVSEESMCKVEEMNVWYKAQYSNTSSLPISVKYTRPGGEQTLTYTYDGLHNITSITDGSNTATYEYDKVNRLVKEENPHFGTCEYAYDQNGNITTKKVNGATYSYTYNGNKLMSFNGESCEYDNMGNPIKYRGNALSWKGRQLSYFNDHHFSYEGTTGRRCSKNSISYTYDENGNLVKQSDGIKYFYNSFGVAGIIKGGVKYHYSKDVQGNIIAILDSAGKVVVQYWYDAWGNHKVVDGNGNAITDQNHIGNVNPFRYRGYYYDTETGLYYLQTRYYDPTTGRFLNRDGIAYADPESIHGLNLYAYCGNNPVNYADPTGHIAFFIITAIIGAIIGFGVTAIVDYCDDGQVFNGSVHWGWYLGAVIIGAIIGAGIGMAISYSATSTISASFTDIRFGFALKAAQNGNYSKLVKFATHNNKSNSVGLGKYIEGSPNSYEILSKKYGYTYFELNSKYWTKAANVLQNNMWEVNKTFLQQQLSLGKSFVKLSTDYSGYYLRELIFLGFL